MARNHATIPAINANQQRQPIQVVGVTALARFDHAPMTLSTWLHPDPIATDVGKGVACPIRVMAATPPDNRG